MIAIHTQTRNSPPMQSKTRKTTKTKPAKSSKTPKADLLATQPHMKPDEFKETLKSLGMEYQDATERLGISIRTVWGYACGDMVISAPVAKLLRLWLQIKQSPKSVKWPAVSQ